MRKWVIWNKKEKVAIILKVSRQNNAAKMRVRRQNNAVKMKVRRQINIAKTIVRRQSSAVKMRVRRQNNTVKMRVRRQNNAVQMKMRIFQRGEVMIIAIQLKTICKMKGKQRVMLQFLNKLKKNLLRLYLCLFTQLWNKHLSLIIKRKMSCFSMILRLQKKQ